MAGGTLIHGRLAVGHAGWLTLEKESYTMTTTATDTKTVESIYVSITRIVDSTTGWSYIERVYASFWDAGHNKLRETGYGIALRTDGEVFEAIQSSLETMTEEGFDYDDPRVRVCQTVKTDIEGTYWNMIGRRV